MKRYNIYLYKYNGEAKERSVGFCRLDLCENKVKVSVNIREDIVGIRKGECVDIEAFLLMDGGEKHKFEICNRWVDLSDKYNIVGVSVIYTKANGIKAKVLGLLDNKEFVEKVEENRIEEQTEECIEEFVEESIKESTDDRFIRFKLEDITTLPRGYWCYAKNKFLLCGYKKYGYLAYMKKGDKYIICVPGTMGDNILSCARRHGFKTFVHTSGGVEGEREMGYWIMSK